MEKLTFFSGRLRQDWGNNSREAMAGLEYIGYRYDPRLIGLEEIIPYLRDIYQDHSIVLFS